MNIDEQDIIEPNEELQYYIGMDISEATRDLEDKEISYRMYTNRYSKLVGDTSVKYNNNRVNLVVDDTNLVTRAFYG